MNIRTLIKPPYIEILLLILISGLVYLPYVPQLTYYLDDWYYIYDGVVGGPNIFHSMFSVDRPARGYFFDIYFSVFGPTPFPYHLGAYFWRLFAGICAFLLLRTIWPYGKTFAFFSAILFVLYPGYSWWVSAVEYQPMVASLALQVFSFFMTIEAIITSKKQLKVFFALFAIFSGWAYLSLVEYAIGMEIFRFICIYLCLSKSEENSHILKKVINSIKTWSWNLIIPLGYSYWRLFLFENTRNATDINLQLQKFKMAPLNVLQYWLGNFVDSLLDLSFYAWYKSFWANLLKAISRSAVVEEIVLAIFISTLLGFYIVKTNIASEKKLEKGISFQATRLGLLSVVAGIIPIVLANRYINLSFYSHYGLPISLAASILLVGLISYIVSSSRIFNLLVGILIVIAGLSNSLWAKEIIYIQKSFENFWWQASWRIPDLLPDSTLITLYPNTKVVDDGLGREDAVSLIYFPETQVDVPIRFPVSNLIPFSDELLPLLDEGKKESAKYRTHKTIINYGNVLVLTQPTPSSCVRVLANSTNIFSENDSELIKKISFFSNIRIVRLQSEQHTPQTYAFGNEPRRGWCYFFEKADLEIQRQNWERAAQYGDEAQSLGLRPTDVVEWYPFIQAYAMMGELEKLEVIALKTTDEDYFNDQICHVFQEETNEFELDLNTQKLLAQLFCK
ncbi:MAG: hypothetical protein IT314_02215 [Anaerolineales bacterium]|nr:hypothetical protein [Anaerolineales bacterium]